MATQAKSALVINLDAMIWDDPIICALPLSAYRAYTFAIAWSRSQRGRTPDGILTQHGCTRIGATADDLAALVKADLIAKKGGGDYEILKYSQWQVTSAEEKAMSEVRARAGAAGAAARYSKELEPPPPLEEGFDVEGAFTESWSEWPEAHEDRYREKRAPAYEAFRANITNKKDFESFGESLMNRLRSFKNSKGQLKERRWSLGAFRNFCKPENWRDWIPKAASPASAAAVASPQVPPPDWKPWEPEF